jgi:hypothetical protein
MKRHVRALLPTFETPSMTILKSISWLRRERRERSQREPRNKEKSEKTEKEKKTQKEKNERGKKRKETNLSFFQRLSSHAPSNFLSRFFIWEALHLHSSQTKERTNNNNNNKKKDTNE